MTSDVTTTTLGPLNHIIFGHSYCFIRYPIVIVSAFIAVLVT